MTLTVDILHTSDIKKEYYVFYNEWDGGITQVCRKKPDGVFHAFFVTADPIAGKILKGDINEHDYIVALTDDSQLEIIKRDEKLRLRSSEKTLHQIPNINSSSDWDIRLKVYTINNKLLMEINPTSIGRLTTLTFRKELLINKETDLSLYITKFNDPNYFIKKLDVDAETLLTTGSLVFDIEDVSAFCGLNNIGVLTRRCFKSYQIQYVNERLTAVRTAMVKNRSFVIDHAVVDFPYPHIIIQNTSDGKVTLKMNTNINELHDIGLFEKQLVLYVTGNTQDEYYGQINIDMEILGQHREVDVGIQADISNLNFLHKKHRLIISKRTATND